MMKNWENAYRNAIYFIEQPSFSLRIDERNEAWNRYCYINGIDYYALVTPFNPASRLSTAEENARKLLDFCESIKRDNVNSYFYRSIDPNYEWPDEIGLVLLNVKPEYAYKCAKKYGQNAFAEAKTGQSLKLSWLI